MYIMTVPSAMTISRIDRRVLTVADVRVPVRFMSRYWAWK